jgi:hypothetical protein
LEVLRQLWDERNNKSERKKCRDEAEERRKGKEEDVELDKGMFESEVEVDESGKDR